MDTNDLQRLIKDAKTNSSLIIEGIVDLVEETTNGSVRFVDPSNPVVLAFETAISIGAVSINHSEAILRKLYASLANDSEELYRHMSDIDYKGRFSNPSTVPFMLGFPVQEIRNSAVPIDINGTKQLIIPANTELVVRGITFSMQYPIIIRVLPHGGIRVTYDSSSPSPLQTLESNIVRNSITRFENSLEYLLMVIPFTQFKVTQIFMTLSASGGQVERIPFSDQYYYCRVYHKMDTAPTSPWVEMKTTHTDQILDVREPTALLKVVDNELVVSIPPIYINTGMIRNSVRVDVYTTQGELTMDMSGVLGKNDIVARWIDLSKDPANSRFIAPIATMPSVRIFSSEVTSGGTNGIGFDELRERVITNSFSSPNLPITPIQLETDLQNRGYNMVKVIDVATKRTYQATRKLPLANVTGTSSSAGCLMSLFYNTIENLSDYWSVKVNGERLTILPTSLFKLVDGKLNIMGEADVAYINNLPIDTRLANINANQYLYTPFHYVLDTSNDAFETRGYYLDGPAIESRQFINENASTLLSVTTKDYALTRIPNGYRLTLTTRSGDDFKALADDQIVVQLSYVAKGERYRATMNGVLLGTDSETGERAYQFDLLTDYEINRDDELYLVSFFMFDDVTYRNLPTGLFTEFELVYIVKDYSVAGLTGSSIDTYVAAYLLDLATPSSTFVGVMQERFGFRLGYALHGLWNKSRTIIGEADYQRHLVDVPDLWPETIYQRDEFGYIVYTDQGGEFPEPVVLHRKNDPKLYENGDPIYLHLAGDLIYIDGELVPVSPRKQLRETNIFVVDGLYYFATSSEALEYKSLIPRSIVSWLSNDIEYYGTKMLEITDLFFYPKKTIGPINVTINGSDEGLVDSDQRLKVQLYVTEDTYRNGGLRASIENEVKQILIANLNPDTRIVSTLDINSNVKGRLNTNVLGMEIKGLGGRNDITTMGILNNAHEMVLGKKIVKTDDGFLDVIDDLEISFSILVS